MKLATWNVNSLNVRLPRLLDWLAANQPDVSPAFATTCTSCRIDREARKGEKPSDHAPVIVELSL